MPNKGGNSGLVCERELGVFSSEGKRRYETLTGEFVSQVEEMKELDDGYAFRVSSESESIVKYTAPLAQSAVVWVCPGSV